MKTEQQIIMNIAVLNAVTLFTDAVLTVPDAVLTVLRILNSCSHLRKVQRFSHVISSLK